MKECSFLAELFLNPFHIMALENEQRHYREEHSFPPVINGESALCYTSRLKHLVLIETSTSSQACAWV